MAFYLLQGIPVRQFDNNGAPVPNARLYAYVAGTTTLQNVYTDRTGVTQLPNPIIADLDGFYPQVWISSTSYDFQARKSDDATVLWDALDVRAPEATANDALASLTADLISNDSATRGLGMTGFGPDVAYAAGTGGRALADLARATVAIGAAGLGDSGPAFRAAIERVFYALGGRGTVVCDPGAAYNITSSIYIPSGVTLDLNGSTLTGTGAAGNTIFISGYDVSGALVSNLAAGDEVGRVVDATIKNGTIKDCGIGFDLKNFNENSVIENIEFSNCGRAIRSLRPFYSSYRRLMSRGSAGGATTPAYYFSTFANVVTVDSVFVVDRVLGWQFDGGCYGVSLTGGCGAETCTNGFLFQGTINSLTIHDVYFESITGKAFEFSGGGSSFYGVDIDNCWFNIVDTCVSAINFTGRWGRGNRRNSGNCYIDFSASTNTAEIELDHTYDATNLTPATPSWLTYGPRCVLNQMQTLYNSGSSLPTVRAENQGERPIGLLYFGDCGDPDTGVVPFATSVSSSPGSTPFDVYVTTNITVRSYSIVAYKIRVTDNVSNYDMFGMVYGTTVDKRDATAKTVTASTVGGKLRLAFSSFSHPSGTFTCTGVVRHV